MTSSQQVAQSQKLKEEGNKYFSKRCYKEAADLYSKAIEKCPSIAAYVTNRALCALKLQQWQAAIDDCRRALELDPQSVKAHFYMGQAMSEQGQFDEALVHLKRADELAKELSENYGDDIAKSVRHVKRKRWNFLEDKRIHQEIELQSYLNQLMAQDKEQQINRVKSSAILKNISDSSFYSAKEGSKIESKEAGAATTSSSLVLNDKQQQEILEIESRFQKRLEELSRLFGENDQRRKKREIPDFLCGKISFELMADPVITPSGITYDRYDIEQHLQRVGRFDPITRQELTIDQLIPNLAMKEVIENFISENEWIDGAY